MRAFVLLSFAVCLAVARPQYNYGQGIGGQQQLQFQAVQAAPSAAVASGQLDQATLDILRQLPSVPTSVSTLLHESHQTLSNGGNGGSAGYGSGAPAQYSAPAAAPAPQYAPAAPQSLGPSPADIAPSHLAAISSGVGTSSQFTFASAAPLQLAPAQQSAPAQPSGKYLFTLLNISILDEMHLHNCSVCVLIRCIYVQKCRHHQSFA